MEFAVDGAAGIRYGLATVMQALQPELTMSQTTLDLSGLQCPMPILKTKKAVAALAPGATIEVLATDPGAKSDFETYCDLSKNLLLESTEKDGVYRFVIQRAA